GTSTRTEPQGPGGCRWLVDPAGHGDVGAGDVAVRGRPEQQYRLGYVGGNREPPGWCSLPHRPPGLGAEGREGGLADGTTRADEVAEDARRAGLPLQGGEEPVERRLRRRVRGRAGPAVAGDTRGDQDDPSSIRAGKVGQRGAYGPRSALEVGAQSPRPV